MTTSTPPISKARQLATRLASLSHGYLAGRYSSRRLIEELRELADWIEGGGKAAPSKTDKEERQIFEYWRTSMGKMATTKFTNDRRAKVKSRLREGYTVRDIKRAIDAVAASEWHRGDNKNGREYCDLIMICASGARLEQYRDMIAPVIDQGPNEPKNDGIAELQKEALEALTEGRMDAYNQAQETIRRIRTSGADRR